MTHLVQWFIQIFLFSSSSSRSEKPNSEPLVIAACVKHHLSMQTAIFQPGMRCFHFVAAHNLFVSNRIFHEGNKRAPPRANVALDTKTRKEWLLYQINTRYLFWAFGHNMIKRVFRQSNCIHSYCIVYLVPLSKLSWNHLWQKPLLSWCSPTECLKASQPLSSGCLLPLESEAKLLERARPRAK